MKESSLPLAKLELIWWIFTALLTLGVLLPILSSLSDYRFLYTNILYVVAFVTLTRYSFQLKYTFLAKRQYLKLVLAYLALPFVFYLVQELNYFQTFLDERGMDALVGELPAGERKGMAAYIRSEMLLFGVGSIISSVVFPVRLVISYWRYRNRGKA
ncbi:MAG: hypothetical protein R3350_09125 [Saprospiraceae bacterium]|nr:hypothetical protein [Saprospiraceae bacterium]